MSSSENIEERREKIRPLLEPANINPKSFLATDYMNHFNEVFMLFEMMADMPDIIEDIDEWQPKSYVEHFQQSAFHDKDLAIEAYEVCPDNVKKEFDKLVSSLNVLIASSSEDLKITLELGDMEKLNHDVSVCITNFQDLFNNLNKIIHSESISTEEEDSELWSQDEIDAIMFD